MLCVYVYVFISQQGRTSEISQFVNICVSSTLSTYVHICFYIYVYIHIHVYMHVCVCPYTHIVIAAFYNKTHGNFKQKKNKNLKLVQTGNQHWLLPMH